MDRTPTQNNAMWQYFENLAETLNDAGFETKAVLAKKSVDVPWSKTTIKKLLWDPIQYAMFDKTSSTKLTAGEVGRVYDTLNRHMIDHFKVGVEFPHKEE